MTKSKNYYDILGIGKDADEKTIKSAYRKLAKKYHPDMHPGDEAAKKKFEEIGEAYEVLRDPEKKKNYDLYGDPNGNPFAGAGAGGYSGNPFAGAGGNPFAGAGRNGGFTGSYRSPDGTTYYYSTSGGNGASDFSSFGGGNGASGFEGFSGFSGTDGRFEGTGFEDLFGNLFGSGYNDGARSRKGSRASGFEGGSRAYSSAFAGDTRGSDLNADITVSFDDAAFGADRILDLGGQGGSRSERLRVHIPAGIEEGKSIRLRGKGAASPVSGGEAGDLYLKVHVSERPGFRREGADVYTAVEVPFVTAALGGEAKLSTLTGQVIVKIKPGTQSGSKIRLRGKGAAVMGKKDAYGDLYAEVKIAVPQHLTREQKAKLQAFADSGV